jgi:hypothetical protein
MSEKITISFDVTGCRHCQFYSQNRYGYCQKMFKDDYEAYHSQGGLYVETGSDLGWLFQNCPFRKKESTTNNNPDLIIGVDLSTSVDYSAIHAPYKESNKNG